MRRWQPVYNPAQEDFLIMLMTNTTNSPYIKKADTHKSSFDFQNNSNKYLELADAFLVAHPHVLYWTEANDTKKGLFYRYEGGIYKACSSFEIENMLLHFTPERKGVIIPRALSDGKIQEVVRNIKKRRFFYRDMFNQENIINFKNGLLNINTNELIDHTMEIISTVQLPYSHDKDAKCPLFMKTINECLEGDLEKIGIFQEFIGYCLTKDTKYEKALFLVGEAGTGKSTMLDAVEYILGEENCSSIRMDMLADSKFTGNLLDKYVNIDNEIPQNISNYEDALKKIISGQKITINTKFIPTYDAKPFCKLIFAANDIPRINDTSNAVFRRILLLDFNNVIHRDKVDVNLKYKLKNECPGIFNWAFEGLERLRRKGRFSTSNDMVERIKQLRLINNSVFYFIEEEYEITEKSHHYVKIDDLYEHYTSFCHEVGAKGVFKKPIFGKEFKKVYGKKVDQSRKMLEGGQKRVWLGIRKKGDVSMMEDGEISEQITWDD